MPRVHLIRGGTWSLETIEQELGVPPLRIAAVRSPVLTIDGYIEPDSSAWLAHVEERSRGLTSSKTALTYARTLKHLAEFLLGQITTLRGATRAHIVSYVNSRTVDPTTRVSGTSWSLDRSAIKQFYEWMQQSHGIDLPFTVDIIRTPHGTITSMREGRNVPKSSAAGTPLEPPQIAELLNAAWRIDANGKASENLTGARDAAFIALGLACGARADTLTHLTIYELPDPALPGDLVEMRLPGVISKSRREVRMTAIRSHLQPVYDYANAKGGSRKLLIKKWQPQDPIRVGEPPSATFWGIIDTKGNSHPFNTMTHTDRRRLITADGEPAMLFLSATDGAPLSYAAAVELAGDASKLAEVNAAANGGFFPHVHTHDLRHTYATHLAALFMLGVATGAGSDMHGSPPRVDIRSAVHMATIALGHVDEGTTALYIQQVGMMCSRYQINHFLGRI